jgi:hypothetical protein
VGYNEIIKMKYYKPYSEPLVGLSEDRIKAGDVVYNELGKCVRKIYVDDNVYFVEVIESVLHEGETMSELTPLQLELFWKLSRNKFHKYGNKDKDQDS